MNTPLVIAHRGARAHAPENTRAAAELALAHKADMWELDTGLSADGELVVLHDDSAERTTNAASRPDLAHLAPWKLADMSFAQLRSLDAGSWFAGRDPFATIQAGEVDVKALQRFAGLPLPTLEEALLFTRANNWRVNVEIKNHAGLKGHAHVTAKVVDLVKKLDMVDMVLLSSFQHQYLREAKALLPAMQRGALVEDVRPQDPVALCQECFAHAYHPQDKLLNGEDVKALHTAGIAVNVWTVNSVEAMQYFMAMGVDGIITDFPARLRALLAPKG